MFVICAEAWSSMAKSELLSVVPFGISLGELQFYSCSYLPGLAFLPLPILSFVVDYSYLQL